MSDGFSYLYILVIYLYADSLSNRNISSVKIRVFLVLKVKQEENYKDETQKVKGAVYGIEIQHKKQYKIREKQHKSGVKVFQDCYNVMKMNKRSKQY